MPSPVSGALVGCIEWPPLLSSFFSPLLSPPLLQVNILCSMLSLKCLGLIFLQFQESFLALAEARWMVPWKTSGSPGPPSCLCHLQAVWPGVSCRAAVRLSVHVHKMRHHDSFMGFLWRLVKTNSSYTRKTYTHLFCSFTQGRGGHINTVLSKEIRQSNNRTVGLRREILVPAERAARKSGLL